MSDFIQPAERSPSAGKPSMSQCSIVDVIAAPAAGAFFFDDQAAIKRGAPQDGFAILGEPVTTGFEAIREPAEAVSVMVCLNDGYVAHGDCVAVQYSGVGGRDPLLRSAKLVPVLEGPVADGLRGRPVTSFRELCACVDELMDELPAFGTAAAYGLSQALLAAVADGAGETMARTIQSEWGLEGPMRPVPVYAQWASSATGTSTR
jgi:methylaspartate ammonia-lyase